MTNKNKQHLKKKNLPVQHPYKKNGTKSSTTNNPNKNNVMKSSIAKNYAAATGKVDYCLTNDYMFRAVFQSNKKALNGLLCAILHLSPEQIRSTRITNPIELGEAFDEKTFILDISILLNNNSYVNLEMQVAKLDYWQERSLAYLCRTFDHLSKGKNYKKTKPTIQVSFLDFTLFPEYPEFFATYRMLNIKNHNVYSDKFTLSVVDLSQIGLATEEDKANKIDAWAALFKATEWEEIKMLAHGNKFMEEAVYAMYRLSKNSKIRQQCEAREDYERRRNGMAERVRMMMKEVEDGRAEVEASRAEVEAGRAEVEASRAEVESGRAEVESGRAEVESGRAEVKANRAKIEAEKVKVEANRAKIEAEKVKVEASKAKIEAEKAEIEANKVKIEADKADIQASKAEIEADKADIQASKAEIEADKADIQASKAEIEAKRAEMQAKEAEVMAKIAALEALETKLAPQQHK